MLTIRLQRVGRKNDPSFRVVVTDSRKGPKSGNYLEILGHHNPRTNTTELKAERTVHWMKNGAQVSGTVHNLLISKGVIEGKKVNVLPKKRPSVKEEEPKTEPARGETAAGNLAEEAPETLSGEEEGMEEKMTQSEEKKEEPRQENVKREEMQENGGQKVSP